MRKVCVLALIFVLVMSTVSCANKAQQGALIGGLGGAAIGGQLGPDENRGENALIGAGIGAVLGYVIGNEWDKYDQRQLNRTMEYRRTGESSHWRNPDTGAEYHATPMRTRCQDEYCNRPCREVKIESYIDGRKEVVYATACRDEYGRWQLRR